MKPAAPVTKMGPSEGMGDDWRDVREALANAGKSGKCERPRKARLADASEKSRRTDHETQKQARHHLVDGAPLEEREINVVYKTSEFVFTDHAIFGSDFTNVLDFLKKGRCKWPKYAIKMRTHK